DRGAAPQPDPGGPRRRRRHRRRGDGAGGGGPRRRAGRGRPRPVGPDGRPAGPGPRHAPLRRGPGGRGARGAGRPHRHRDARAGDGLGGGGPAPGREGRALQGRDVGGEPRLLGRAPAVPRRGADPARPGARRVARRVVARAGRAAHGRAGQRALAHQPAARQPVGAQAGVRDRRVERAGRRPPDARRPGHQPGAPAAGGPLEPARGQGARGDAGQGRVPQPADGAHPVRAADRRGPRDPDPGEPAVDQQVLHHGSLAGPQPAGVGGAARAHGVRHQLPRPRRVHGRRGARRLPRAGQPGRAGRRAGHHRRREGQPRRPVPGRPHGHHRRRDAPRPRPGAPPQLADADEHPARLLGPGSGEQLRRPRDPRPARAQDGQDRLPALGVDGGHVRPAPRQRPDLQLRRAELARGQGPAGLRHPGVERRLHPHAGEDARVLPAALLPDERAGPRRARAARRAPVAEVGHQRHLHRGRDQRPHRAVADVVPVDHPARRRRHLHAVQRRPHRRRGQPARPEGQVLDRHRRRRLRAGRRHVEAAGHRGEGLLVGAVARLDGRARRRDAPAAAHRLGRVPAARGRARLVRPRYRL
ncbi:MAG: Polyhydroxyalkanoic acid synthase, partial [uncultured Actinomycetospora sp.]